MYIHTLYMYIYIYIYIRRGQDKRGRHRGAAISHRITFYGYLRQCPWYVWQITKRNKTNKSYIYIYIHIYRQRERDSAQIDHASERIRHNTIYLSIYTYDYIYDYIYIYIYTYI